MTNLRNKVKLYYKYNSSWIDATNGLLQADITRGIPDYRGCWSQVAPGQLRIRTKNLDLDPSRNANISLYSEIKISVNGITIFTGKIIDAQTDYFPKDDAILTLNIFDEIGILALRKFGNITVINQNYDAKTIIVPTCLPLLFVDNSSKMCTDNVGGGENIVQGIASYQYGYQESPILGYDYANDLIVNQINADQYTWGSRIKVAPTLSTGITPDGLDGIWADKPPSPGFTMAGKTHGTVTGAWCALQTTNDTDALSLFLKSEQSEAGFAFINKDNKFVIQSRAYIDSNPSIASKASFKSDGTGISYNNIKVTNGWESVVKGITVTNGWTDNYSNWYENIAPVDKLFMGNIYGYYQNPPFTNRDGTTGTKILNITPAPNLEYPWLAYGAAETKAYYQKYAKTSAASGSKTPIYNIQTRDWDVTKLSNKSIFMGKSSINGSNQLSINTNYAMTGSTGGGTIYNRNGVLTTLPDPSTTTYLDNVDDRMNELADRILTDYSNPVIDVRSIDFDVHVDDINTIAGIDIFDRISLNHSYAGYSVNKQYAVMGITHSITPNNWSVKYELWNKQGRP